MDHFVWKDNFGIGIDEIDDQHKLFLDYVNDCYNAVYRDHDSRVTDATIYDLKTYAATHFLFESELMREIGYPDRENHIRLHGYFVSQITDMEKAQAAGNKRTVESLVVFLKDWFLNHILEHDKKYAAFLKSHGSRPSRKPAGSRS